MENKVCGNLFIVAAPSGGGKTSLVKNLIQSMENIAVSISHTTREPRPMEKHGVDYFFIRSDEFLDMVNNKQFIEHARVYKECYGTSVAEVNHRLTAGIDVVLDIDWQGAAQIKKVYPQAIAIFIIPPSLSILEKRLQDRQQDNKQVIGERMKQAQDELSHFAEFDYLIVNDNFAVAAEELKAIVTANRLSRARQEVKHAKLLSFLLMSQ
jgi:guanylate kinase